MEGEGEVTVLEGTIIVSCDFGEGEVVPAAALDVCVAEVSG